MSEPAPVYYTNDLMRRLVRFLAAQHYGRMYIKHPRLHNVHTYHIESQDCEACKLWRELKAYVEDNHG